MGMRDGPSFLSGEPEGQGAAGCPEIIVKVAAVPAEKVEGSFPFTLLCPA